MFKISQVLEEDLEINKLKKSEDIAKRLGESSLLYDELNKEKKLDTPDDTMDEAESEDPSSADDSTEPSTPPEESQEEVVQESLRALSYSIEDDSLLHKSGNVISSTAGFLYTNIKDALVIIGTLGIVYGPGILKNVYKGVVFVFSKLVKLLYFSSKTLTKYLDRRINSFENLKNDLVELKKSIELLSSKEVSETESSSPESSEILMYANQKVINTLKIKDSVDFTSNIKVLSSFVSKTITRFHQAMLNDVSAVKYLISSSQTGVSKVPAGLYHTDKFKDLLRQRKVIGYDSGSEVLETYVSSQTLPSDIVLIATLSRDDIADQDTLKKAYQDSNIVLGIDTSEFTEINKINYMTNEELSSFIDSLTKLCDVCIEHQKYYENIQKIKHTLKLNYRNYFSYLAHSQEKISMHDSLVEHVYIKSVFVDKVYLVAMMDIHDYCAKVISNGLSLVKDNIKHLN